MRCIGELVMLFFFLKKKQKNKQVKEFYPHTLALNYVFFKFIESLYSQHILYMVHL